LEAIMRYDLSTATLRVRDIYRIGWDVLTRNSLHMLLLFGASVAPAAVVETMLNHTWGVDPVTGVNVGRGLLSSSIAWTLLAISLIYIMRLTAEDIRGNTPTAAQLFTVVLRAYVPMLAGYVFLAISFLIGLILFVVPGILVIVWLSFFPAFIVIENESLFASFGASYRLVRGHFFHVIGMSLALLLPILLVVLLLQMAVSGPSSQFFALLLGNTLNFYFTIMVSVFFLNVRKTWKEKDIEGVEATSVSQEASFPPA
jgi:hypothetical protein